MKRHIFGAGGAIVLCLAAYFSYSIAAALPVLSLVEPASNTDATFSDLAPDWCTVPTWRVKRPRLRAFCAGLCTDEELMR